MVNKVLFFGVPYRNIASGSFGSDLGLVVSYNYTPSPVPEPASALGTLGLLARWHLLPPPPAGGLKLRLMP